MTNIWEIKVFITKFQLVELLRLTEHYGMYMVVFEGHEVILEQKVCSTTSIKIKMYCENRITKPT